MKRIAIALAAGAALSTVAYASASVLDVDGGTIQAGQDTTQCDENGVKANWGLETDTNSVSSVRISDVDAECAGAEMFVSVNGQRIGKKTIGSTGQESFPFSSPKAPETINDVKIWIEG